MNLEGKMNKTWRWTGCGERQLEKYLEQVSGLCTWRDSYAIH